MVKSLRTKSRLSLARLWPRSNSTRDRDLRGTRIGRSCFPASQISFPCGPQPGFTGRTLRFGANLHPVLSVSVFAWSRENVLE